MGRVEGQGKHGFRGLDVAKTKKMVVGFRRNKPRPLQSASVGRTFTLWILKNTWVWCWTINCSGLQTWRQFTKSFIVCKLMRQMFYQSVVTSTIFFPVVSWGAGIKVKDANRLNELKKTGSVVGSELVTLVEVVEDRMLAKLLAIIDHASHPLHKTLDELKCSSGHRLAQLVERASHVLRLCSGPGFDSRSGSLCCMSLLLSRSPCILSYLQLYCQ